MASPIDGLFDVFVIPGASKLRVWTRIFKILVGRPGRWDGVALCRGRGVRVTVDGLPPDERAVRRRAFPLLVLPESVERLRARQAEVEVEVPGASEAGAAPAVHLVSESHGAAPGSRT
jgi:hypothetical protein